MPAAHEGANLATGHPRRAPVSVHSLAGLDPGLLLLLGGAASAAAAVSGHLPDAARGRPGSSVKRGSDWIDAGQRQGSSPTAGSSSGKVPRLRECHSLPSLSFIGMNTRLYAVLDVLDVPQMRMTGVAVRLHRLITRRETPSLAGLQGCPPTTHRHLAERILPSERPVPSCTPCTLPGITCPRLLST